jgi:hypothetical protein
MPHTLLDTGWVTGLFRLPCCAAAFVLVLPGLSAARDDGRYAQSPLKSWFDSLASRKGPCCSDADGSVVADPDWEFKNGHYRVRVEQQWWDVPPEAVITEPNRYGRTMVWPLYDHVDEQRVTPHGTMIDIRCFLPGPMS